MLMIWMIMMVADLVKTVSILDELETRTLSYRNSYFYSKKYNLNCAVSERYRYPNVPHSCANVNYNSLRSTSSHNTSLHLLSYHTITLFHYDVTPKLYIVQNWNSIIKLTGYCLLPIDTKFLKKEKLRQNNYFFIM